MTYRVIIDELVFNKDFKKIDPADQRRIIKALRQKLTSKPKEFGRPLHSDLKGYWKLRVGEYRIIYSVEEEQALVYVVLVGFRDRFGPIPRKVQEIPGSGQDPAGQFERNGPVRSSGQERRLL